MRTVKTKQITENIREMCIEANHFLTGDMTEALDRARESEKAPLGKQILQQLQENLQIAGAVSYTHLTRYHLSDQCTYLRVKVQAVSAEETENMRNGSGEKYTACERCKPVKGGLVYLTAWGNRYHGESDCSALQRTVYMVPQSEAGGRSACSKCG